MLSERVKKLRLGSVLYAADGFIAPVDCGSMISSDRFGELERVVTEAVQDGAQLETGGARWKHAYLEGGSYFSPTVIGNVHQGMEIAQRECASILFHVYRYKSLQVFAVFAPVAALMPYEEIDDAIELANNTKYGLGASVFGHSQEQCLEVAKRLDCGMVSINDFGVFYVSYSRLHSHWKANNDIHSLSKL